MLGFLLWLLIAGLIVGAIARLLVPGPDPIGLGGTILLGIVGSFGGGFLADVLFRPEAQDRGLRPAGWLGSIIGAVIVLLIYRWATSRRGRRTYV
ncbi:MAG: GlsB/YeaQ/YmgE family stress response membrane protein [Acidimicrobiales bacterium]